MPMLSVPNPTFQRLAERAAALNITVEELVTPALELLAQQDIDTQPPTDDWQRQFNEWMNHVAGRANRYPPNFQLDDSRESMYEGRAQ